MKKLFIILSIALLLEACACQSPSAIQAKYKKAVITKTYIPEKKNEYMVIKLKLIDNKSTVIKYISNSNGNRLLSIGDTIVVKVENFAFTNI